MGWILEDGWQKRWVDQIMLHCSGREDLVDAASIDKFHREVNKWRMIGYHYVIRPDGKVEKGRELKEIGAHVLGHNRNSIGICFISHDGRFTIKQMVSGRHLVANLCWDHNIPRSGINCHYEFNDQKTCPDFKREDFLALLRSGL